MKVRKVPARHAYDAWWEGEMNIREAYAWTRLDHLDKLATELHPADRFDAAYAIWDDFIDGQRAADRIEQISAEHLTMQASIFARVSEYLNHAETHALAVQAWGNDLFEVYLVTGTPATVVGKLSWMPRTQTLRIRYAGNLLLGIRGRELIIKTRNGKVRYSDCTLPDGAGIELHPAFGRTA